MQIQMKQLPDTNMLLNISGKKHVIKQSKYEKGEEEEEKRE